MITFKQFLADDIIAKDGELLAAVNNDTKPRSSEVGRVNTNRRPLGRVASSTRDTPVYYAFSYIPDPDKESKLTTNLLTSLKGKGPYEFPSGRRDKFLDDSTSHMAAEFKRMKIMPDVIVAPTSSSAFLMQFAEALASKLGVQVKHLNAFKKTKEVDLPDDREKALEIIKKKYIDYDYLDKKFTGGDRDKTEREIASSILRSIRQNDGQVQAKEIFKRHGKFVKGFMAHDLKGDDEYSLVDKTVMVIDDVLSSGSTMSDMFRIVRDDLLAADVYGATLLSRTTAAKT